MAETAVAFISYMEGTLKDLAIGLGTDVHVGNVRVHVRKALHHTESTPEIEMTAGRLVTLGEEFGRYHRGPAIGQQAKDSRDHHLARMEVEYLALRKLLEAAKPSAVANALGIG